MVKSVRGERLVSNMIVEASTSAANARFQSSRVSANFAFVKIASTPL
jgi:hypothetical protein